MSGLFSATPAAAAAAAVAPVQSFKFNFSAAADDDDAAMQDDGADAANAKTAATAATPPLQRKALQHQPSASAAAAPSSSNDVELLTLHASSTFSVSPVDSAAAATAAASSPFSSSSAAAAAAAAPALALRFLKRRSVGAHTALKDLLNESDIITQVYEGGFKVRRDGAQTSEDTAHAANETDTRARSFLALLCVPLGVGVRHRFDLVPASSLLFCCLARFVALAHGFVSPRVLLRARGGARVRARVPRHLLPAARRALRGLPGLQR